MFRCNDVAAEWSYSVEFGGLGDPLKDWTHVGHCSQYAVFRRLHKPAAGEASPSGQVYERVCTAMCRFLVFCNS